MASFEIEVKIKRGRRVARGGGNGPQGGAVQTFGFKHLAGGLQDQSTLEVPDGLLPALALLDRHAC